MPLLNVSVHHYTPEDFTAAMHTFELKRRDETILHLDHAHCGLGSNSCGPGPLPQYLLKPEETTFSVRLKPFSVGCQVADEPVSDDARGGRVRLIRLTDDTDDQ